MKSIVLTDPVGGFHESQCLFLLESTYILDPLSGIRLVWNYVEVQEWNCKTIVLGYGLYRGLS